MTDLENREQGPERRPGSREVRAVVGIGASAGGLTALKAFFSKVPENTGIVWVVVVHLPPQHESHLADLLQGHVHIPVRQVQATVLLEPDQVYVIPPGANLSAIDTHLRLSQMEEHRQHRAPIDFFFRTLAATHDGHSVGVILTGTGSDGALGVKAIKEQNGYVLVQDPAEAEFDGMPQSAIATGVVDQVLPLDELPAAVMRFARTRPNFRVPKGEETVEGEERQLLQKIFAQVRTRSNRDFSRYKQSTLLRRIERRMQIREVVELSGYLALLLSDSDEVQALADDILITVTSFFRDPEIWDELAREVIPSIFEGKGPEDQVRIWSVGCATGEEAYSLAMLLMEEAARHEAPPGLQIFASDLHERSLARAREGFYPGDIETDVTEPRLRRFFEKQDGGYRIRKEVRERVVFAPHNVLGAPPFSRIDLVSCRNVMIYLQREVQLEVLEVFHYALNPEGVLLLGTAETIEGSGLFRAESKQHHIYRRRNVAKAELRLPLLGMTRSPFPPEPRRQASPSTSSATSALHQRMLGRYAPPSMLVSSDDRIIHLAEGTGRFLVHPGGEPTTNVYRLVREELRGDLRAALHQARVGGEATRFGPVPVGFDGVVTRVGVEVRPAVGVEYEGFALVVFEEKAPGEEAGRPVDAAAAGANGGDSGVAEAETELEQTRQRLQAIIVEYESTQEEMRASHEELQSANEELRSTLEELETSREELQSMNEELQTVNQENRHKVAELAQLSNDLQNLLTSTDIATLFLDRDLRILRFTPNVGELFNVRAVDRGRPLSDLTSRLGYGELREDADRVLRSLVPVEREVIDHAGRWYLTRVLPYRSNEDRIAGVVITFVDITRRKKAEDATGRFFALTLDLLAIASTRTGNWVKVSAGFSRALGWTEPELLLIPFLQLVHPDDLERSRAAFNQLAEGDSLLTFENRVRCKDGSYRWIEWETSTVREEELMYCAGRDVTGRRSTEEALRESQETQLFLVRLGDVLRSLDKPHEIQNEASRLLGNHLGVSRALYVEVADEDVLIQGAYTRGVEPLPPRMKVANYGAALLDSYDRGETLVIEDVATDPGLGPDERRAFQSMQTSALVAVMILKEGRWTASLAVHSSTPRKWAEREVDLLRQTAERVWALSERARATVALRASEERHRLIVENALDYAIITMDLDGSIETWSPGAESVFGWKAEEAIGRRVDMTFTAEDRERGAPERERQIALAEGVALDVRLHARKDESGVFIEGVTRVLQDPSGGVKGFMKIGQDVTRRHEAEAAVMQLNETLERRVEERTAELSRAVAARSEVLRQLVTAEEETRRRISRELHDQMGQQLTGLMLGLRSVQAEAGEGVVDRIRELERLAAETARDMQSMAVELRPPALDALGLVSAVQNHLEEWSRRHGTECDFHARGLANVRLLNEIETTLYRITQEGLTNALRHAEAHHVSLILERKDGMVLLILEDDGNGFDVEETLASADKARRLGVRGMRERVALLGGTLDIESAPGSGTTIYVKVPEVLTSHDGVFSEGSE